MKLEVLELYTACYCIIIVVFVFFNDTATTEIYTYGHTLSLHDALPICRKRRLRACPLAHWSRTASSSRGRPLPTSGGATGRSEEHTSELQSLMRISYAVFCLKKKKKIITNNTTSLYNKQTT